MAILRISIIFLLVTLSCIKSAPTDSAAKDSGGRNGGVAALFAKLSECIKCNACPPEDVQETEMEQLENSTCLTCVRNCYFVQQGAPKCEYWKPECGCRLRVSVVIKKCRSCLGMPGVENECVGCGNFTIGGCDPGYQQAGHNGENQHENEHELEDGEREHGRQHKSKSSRRLSRGRHRHDDD